MKGIRLHFRSKKQENMKIGVSVKLSVAVAIVALFIGCENANDPKYNPPADHTINQSGYMHKSGLNQPLTNCVSCHGADLKGGSTGVSCFECHGTKW